MKPLPHGQYDSLFGKFREHCSGGRRFFNIHPDGSVYRCSHTEGHSIGDICDPVFRQDIVLDLARPYPCFNPQCVASCGGLFTEQRIGDIIHTGEEPFFKKMSGTHYAGLNMSLTHVCNFSCSYCSAEPWMAEAANTKRKVMSVEEWLAVGEFFTSHFHNGYASVLGGEPTVHKCFVQLGHLFIKKGWFFDMITNLSNVSKIIEYYDGLSKEECDRSKLVFSAHVAQPKFNLEKSLDVLRHVRSKSADAPICVVYVDSEDNRKALSSRELSSRVEGAVGFFHMVVSENILQKIKRYGERHV